MANQVRKLAEVQETEWTQASGKILAGLAVFVVAVGIIYATKFMPNGGSPQVVRIVFGLVAFAGLALAGAAVYRGVQTRKLPGIGYLCPYCDREIKFESQPNSSFECDYCNRTVHFDDGEPIPVRTVSCPFCHTDHRVAENVQRYVCDRCNRPLELAAQRSASGPPATLPGTEAAPANYDVLLLAADRRHEIEIAMKLQNLLVVNLPEARRLMAGASTTAPLVVAHSLPQRKAETIRRQLQDVGATATLRPSTGAGAPSRPN